MPTIYETDAQRVFTGVTREIPLSGGAPLGWTRLAPPEIPAGKFARWLGPSWELLDEYPAPPEPSIEEVRAAMAVPRLSARLALIESDKWNLIPPIIDAITDPVQQAQTLAFFEDAQRWKRLDATVQALGAALGLDDAGLDALFVRAQEIDASLL